MIAALVSSALLVWARAGNHGVAVVDSGCILARNPDTVRGPDVAFVRRERVPASGVPVAFWDLAPDLAIEIVSPSNTPAELRERVGDVLAGGTPLVWEIRPTEREVVVHQPGVVAVRCGIGETLSFPEALPGFSCAVADLV